MNVRTQEGTVVSQDAVTDGVDETRLKRAAKETLEGGPITGKEAAALLAKSVEKINEAAKKGLVRFGRHEFKTNDDDSDYLSHKLKEGAAVSGVLSAIFGALAGTVVGAAPGLIASVICAILAGVAAIVADDIDYKNDGCGVIIHIDHLPVYGPLPPLPELTFNYSVESQ